MRSIGQGYACKRCGQPLTRLERPWTSPTVDGMFISYWVNPFGFPWCPGTDELNPHTTRDAEFEDDR